MTNDKLKFRVWNEDKNQYNSDLDKDWVDAITFDGDIYNINPATNDCGLGGFNNRVIEQCTGLKDKNGKPIYEGDVLGGYYGGYVKWCDRCKSFETFFGDECAACNGDVLWAEVVEDDGKLEVIGNVHKNPELLK